MNLYLVFQKRFARLMRQIAVAVFLLLPLAQVVHASQENALAAAAQTAISVAGQLTGDTKLSCEAVLCLSAMGSRPGECSAAISRYFSITGDNMSADRFNFLNLCPTASASPEMQDLTRALVGSAGRCDVADLNAMKIEIQVQVRNQYGEIETVTKIVTSNRMPPGCASFYANPIIASQPGERPAYVGTLEGGGYWVANKDYSAASADYNRQLEAHRAASRPGFFRK